MSFVEFPKMARWSRDITITEKLDGTNAQIGVCLVSESEIEFKGDTPLAALTVGGLGWYIYAGSRNRWLTRTSDNYGFAKYAEENAAELVKLGPGRHFGEWWGGGVQRGYGLLKGEKRFSLFNVGRWCASDDVPVLDAAGRGQAPVPKCCHVVPTIYMGPNTEHAINWSIDLLKHGGSYAAPGFMDPEGVVIFHTAGNRLYKKTIKGDESPKSVFEKKNVNDNGPVQSVAAAT